MRTGSPENTRRQRPTPFGPATEQDSLLLTHKERFSVDAAQSFGSVLRKSWVREHLRAQETQNLGARAFDAVRRWHVGGNGRPRFKPASRGLHSLSAKDGNGALRSKTDVNGRLVGLQSVPGS